MHKTVLLCQCGLRVETEVRLKQKFFPFIKINCQAAEELGTCIYCQVVPGYTHNMFVNLSWLVAPQQNGSVTGFYTTD